MPSDRRLSLPLTHHSMCLRRKDLLIPDVEPKESLATFVPGPPDGEVSEAVPNGDVQTPLLAQHHHHVTIAARNDWQAKNTHSNNTRLTFFFIKAYYESCTVWFSSSQHIHSAHSLFPAGVDIALVNSIIHELGWRPAWSPLSCSCPVKVVGCRERVWVWTSYFVVLKGIPHSVVWSLCCLSPPVGVALVLASILLVKRPQGLHYSVNLIEERKLTIIWSKTTLSSFSYVCKQDKHKDEYGDKVLQHETHLRSTIVSKTVHLQQLRRHC